MIQFFTTGMHMILILRDSAGLAFRPRFGRNLRIIYQVRKWNFCGGRWLVLLVGVALKNMGRQRGT